MPVFANQNSHMAWLLGRLANRRNRIIDLVRRMTGMGPAGGMKPSLFAKFLHMMDDVAAATREESRIIGRIEEIEQKHRLLRAGKQLRKAVKLQSVANINECSEKPVRSSNGLLRFLMIWYLFLQQKNNHKKQDLTSG